MSRCLQCGICCRVVSLDHSSDTLRQLAEQERKRLDGPTPHRAEIERLLSDVEFILKHFHLVERSEALELNPQLEDVGNRTYYRCDALDKGGKCSQHGKRPYLCEGYPWYLGRPNPDLLIHRPCGYEQDLGGET